MSASSAAVVQPRREDNTYTYGGDTVSAYLINHLSDVVAYFVRLIVRGHNQTCCYHRLKSSTASQINSESSAHIFQFLYTYRQKIYNNIRIYVPYYICTVLYYCGSLPFLFAIMVNKVIERKRLLEKSECHIVGRFLNSTWHLRCSVVSCDQNSPQQKFAVTVSVNFVAVPPTKLELPSR